MKAPKKLEQMEIRGPDGLRVGTVNQGEFIPYGRYFQNPCPEFLYKEYGIGEKKKGDDAKSKNKASA